LMASVTNVLKIACVPEHFSTPIYRLSAALQKNTIPQTSISLEIVSCPGGTGQMLQLLRENEVDFAVALTEGLVVSLAQSTTNFRICGTYVNNPLTWAVSTHPSIPQTDDPSWILGKRIGISRFGSGSHIIPHIIPTPPNATPFTFVECKDIHGLVSGIQDNKIDAFLWEKFTTRLHHSSGRLSHHSSITPSWPAFMVASHTSLSTSIVNQFMGWLTTAVHDFVREADLEEVAKLYRLSIEDVRGWWKQTSYPTGDLRGVDMEVLREVKEILLKSGVIKKGSSSVNEMVADGVVFRG